MSGDSVLRLFIMFRTLLTLALIWMFSSNIVECQQCSTLGLNVFGGYRYVFFHGYPDTIGRTFDETRAHCQSLGGDMPVITSAEQNNFIAGLTVRNGGNYYIGLEDMDGDDVYNWIDGTTPEYNNWDPNLYTQYNPPYCAVMRSHTYDSIQGKWNRVTCTSMRRNICQIPIDVRCRWHELGESQYLIMEEPAATADDARATCQSYGGDLALIKTAEINAFLKDLLPPCESCGDYFCYWFGLSRTGGGDFTWLDGTTTEGYTDWYDIEPNNANSWGCLGLRSGPSWYDHVGKSLPYICERTRVFEQGSEALFGGMNYFISPSWLDRSYSDARTFCQYHGADLALIKSEHINNFLIGRNLRSNACFFFGLTDQTVEGIFTWIDGTPLQYYAWTAGVEPNGGDRENCVCLSSNVGWIDISCSTKQHFICERYQFVPDDQWSRIHPLNRTEYYISQSWMTSYSFARRFCQAQGGDLAQPKTEEINNLLLGLSRGNSFWIGLESLQQEDILRWIDGTALDPEILKPWSTIPTDWQTENCVHQFVTNGWSRRPCTSYIKFACERYVAPKSARPVHLQVVTSTPYGGGLPNTRFLCLLSPPDNTSSTPLYAQRLVNINGADTPVPGINTMISDLPVVINQSLPNDSTAVGFYQCWSYKDDIFTYGSVAILSNSRKFQPMDGRFTKTIYAGESITLNVSKTATYTADDSLIRWRRYIFFHNESLTGSNGMLSHSLESARVNDARVYLTYEDMTLANHQYSFIRLIVKDCPRGKWSPPFCDRPCDICYNGGICHDDSGTCICPPGFAGQNCLKACGKTRFGWDCELECGTGHALDVCSGSQICLPDPYGCNCLSGFTGIYCNESCTDGKFGVNCLEDCHCSGGTPCDIFKGTCPGNCEDGWSGPQCQVPSDCTAGYYGENCTLKCNCQTNKSCNRESGLCNGSDGLCEAGYTNESPEFPVACLNYVGCYSSCSQTCHCFGGVKDCLLGSGECLSGTCHPRWTGDRCETDRFQIQLEKTNRGVVNFSCSVTRSPGQQLAAKDIKATIGSFDEMMWTDPENSEQSNSSIVNYFHLLNVNNSDNIFCFIGNTTTASHFAYKKIPQPDFFEQPTYSGTPKVFEKGFTYVQIGWRQWDPFFDTGDGPIVGYKIYVRSGSDVVLAQKVQPPIMLNNTDTPIMKRSAENVTDVDMVMYNVSRLEAGSTYKIQIAAIRDGINGEGEQGPALTFTTERPSPVTPSTTLIIGVGGDSDSIAPTAGGAVGAILVILIMVIVVIVVFKRRRNDSHPSKKENIEDQFQASPDFHNTSLEENDYNGHLSAVSTSGTPPATRPKPARAVKPFLRETKSLDVDSTDRPARSSNTPVAKRQPIPLAEYPAFVHKNRHTELLSEEFHDLPDPDIYPQTVALEKINFKKNRYKNILPYDLARVKLDIINNDPHSDYFNASYIPSFYSDKAYIASQGPNNASMDDFWRMVWQENVTTIAMVTKLKEGDKIKCRQYWPDRKGDAVQFGKIRVELLAVEPCTGGVSRRMVMGKDEEFKRVTQFHYVEWPDKGVPKHTSSLLNFIKELKADHGQNVHPLIVHCSAGVGRTGVVISIDSVVAHAKRSGVIDVFNFVTNIRQKRPYMVQTQEQYAFIYGAVLEDLLWRRTMIPAIHFTDHLQDLRTSLDGRGRSKMTKEFETLKSLCPNPPAFKTRSGRTPDNHPKNRYGNDLPLERNRVRLDSTDQDYINATYMKGAHCTFMTTQMPMPNTVCDFWAMVLDYKPSIIVMLNDASQNDKSCAQYWSDDDFVQFESYSVSTLSSSSDRDMTTRNLKVTRNSKASHTVTQYQFRGWPKKESKRQSGARSLLKLIRTVNSSPNRKNEYSILVHCLSGVGRTGVFCTVMECIAQIAEGDTIDIFQTVKMLRADRMQFVKTEEEYAFIYDVIREYLLSENYEQLPYSTEDHTYGNVETENTPDPEENPYEVTDSQDATTAALVYGNVVTERDEERPKPKAQESYSVYQNLAFES